MRRRAPLFLFVILCALAFAGASTSFAQTPDGLTPAEEFVCDLDKGNGALFGLCNSFCEAKDCDSESPFASAKSCQTTYDLYVDKSGGLEPPCVEACPCKGRIDIFDTAVTFPQDPGELTFPCLNLLNDQDPWEPITIVCGPPGFSCGNDTDNNAVAVGTVIENGVSFCGGTTAGQGSQFFAITENQRDACIAMIQFGPYGFGQCADFP